VRSRAVIQVSTFSDVVGSPASPWGDGADFGVRLRCQEVRKAYRSLVVSPSLTFRTDVQFVQMPAKQARGLLSLRANQTSPPSALLNSLKLLNGTTQRFSMPATAPSAF
jgi:hypothetical protein